MRRRRKKTLKQWAAFGRRGMRKRRYQDSFRLHEYEHAIILRDAIAAFQGAPFDAFDLDRVYPGRYDVTTTKLALKRMIDQGLLKRSRFHAFGRNRGPSVSVKGEILAAAA